MRNIRTNPQAGLDDHTKKRRRGQSLVEFALILPILLTLTGAAIDVEGAPDKVIRGYFVSPVNAEELVVSQGGGTSELNTGVTPIKLTN